MRKEEKSNPGEQLLKQLFETMHTFRLAADRKLKAHNIGLSPEQFKTLVEIHHHEGIIMSDLALCSFRDKTTVTRMIDGLERLNLVVRVPSESDRRQIRLYLTAAGKKTVEKVKSLNPNLGERIEQAITKAELKTVYKTLEKIKAALEKS
jgi:DNA-binding MarR family transcriptional regulator